MILPYQILKQAIDDYKNLKAMDLTWYRDMASFYSIKDIETFFKGKWSTRLLEMIGSNLTGEDILRRLQSQKYTKEMILCDLLET